MDIEEQPWRKMEKNSIMDVIETRNLSMFSGKYLVKAEQCLEVIYPDKKALLLNSGTAALHIALKCFGIGPGDEVILPAITYPATALAVTYVGATPVFVDIDPDSFTLDPDACLKALTKNTKAVIYVHLFGVSGNIEKVADICNEQEIILIEDCAQAFGSKLKGKRVGTYGHAGCFSFFESKTISAGEGGALILSNINTLELGRRYRHHGMDTLNNDKTVKVEGFNYKPSEFQSALIFTQLTYQHEIISRRMAIASFIRKLLSPNVVFQAIRSDENVVLDKLCLIFNNTETRDFAEICGRKLGLFRYLKVPLYKEPVFSLYNPYCSCPVSESFCERHLVMQLSPYIMYDKIEIEINSFLNKIQGGVR